MSKEVKKKGFTLAEVLMVVAIMAILFALAVPAVASIQKTLRQKELDSKAETIYVAVQNRLSELYSSGQTSLYNPKLHSNSLFELGAYPSDYDIEYSGDIGKNNVHYFTSGDSEYVNELLGDSTLSDELKDLGHYVIEIIPYSYDSENASDPYQITAATVYGVFYSEALTDCSKEYASNGVVSANYNGAKDFRRRENRLADGSKVGYYGGSNPGSGTGTSALSITKIAITSENEVNKAIVNVKKPTNLSGDINVIFKIEDTFGNERTIEFNSNRQTFLVNGTNISTNDKNNNIYTWSNMGLSYTFTFILDDLSSNQTRFDYIYGSGQYASGTTSGYSTKLTPGADIKLTATVAAASDATVSPATKTVYGNSIYEYGNGLLDISDVSFNQQKSDISSGKDLAIYISNGRHLQNLDSSSNVTEKVKEATLIDDINFKETTNLDDGFYANYSSEYFNGLTSVTRIRTNGETYQTNVPNFKSITNSYLKSLNGLNTSTNTNYVIYNLTSNAGSGGTSSAGLFGNVNNSELTISNITMVGTNLNGGSAGLIGNISTGNVKLNNVKLYLSTKNNDIPSAILASYNLEANRFITGNQAGGLVGSNSGNLTIENSFASTVIGQAGGITGGLVGYNFGALTINKSYADSYLYGNSVGGLVGHGAGTINISTAYAAGFIGLDNVATSVGAGLIKGDATSLNNVYTVIKPYNVATDGGIDRNSSNNEVDSNITGTYFSTVSNTSLSNYTNLYYSKASTGTNVNYGVNDVSNMTLVGFNDANTSTNPYKLMGQSISTYPYKKIEGLDHYGDWDASFTPGALVYYEKYQNGNTTYYGFEGANVELSITPNDVIVGDGYGVVFKSDSVPDTFTVNVNSNTYTVNTKNTSYYEVTKDGVKYYIYPVSSSTSDTKAFNNPTSVSDDYYTRVKVSFKYSNNGTTERYYDFNPHFARSIVDVNASSDPISSKPQEISIRSPRQLNNLSKYYSSYHSVLDDSNVTYTQERDMDFANYEWSNFSNVNSVSTQQPIGVDENVGFGATYDGGYNEIGNISFVTESGHYLGMFGYVSNSATIKNVVIATQYSLDNTNTYYVNRTEGISKENDYLYAGVLAGYSNGTIENCAVAGYYLAGGSDSSKDYSIRGYQNTTIYVGGLVGYNDEKGVIRNSSSDSPKMSLDMYQATCFAGGFVGNNEGQINNSYGLNHITSTADKGTTYIAGFAGYNSGRISNSYCATALTSSGEGSTSYLFTGKNNGGSVTNSFYLYQGSYRYVDAIYSYGGDANSTTRSAGVYKTYKDLASLSKGSTATYSLYNDITLSYLSNSSNKDYPFRAVVKDAGGNYVHYGEWQVSPSLGTYGVFYWEHETGGDNNNFNLTYIGKTEGTLQYGSTLCVQHDDSGYIDEYGYGYYVLNDDVGNISTSSDGIKIGSSYNTSAKKEFESQFPGLTFYPYTTTNDETNNNYIYLTTEDINGTVTLKYNDKESTTFYISPYFANALAMQVDSETYNKYSGGIKTYLTTETVSPLDNTDNQSNSIRNSLDDSNNIPGSKSNPFEIRSATQLQYINWNSNKKNYTELVDSTNYKKFNYLMYTSSTGTAEQSKTDAGNSNNSKLYFKESHDIKETDDSFVPVAGQKSSTTTSYNAVLYAWFGSNFDGQSYKIQELNINSKSTTVGMFGVTAGANLNNIILYSTKDAVIQRNTENTDSQASYAVGGLVGVAYDYGSDTSKSTNYIKNCAIAGYKIEDNSKNKLGLGEANVGGLVGVCNTNIDKCSAVTDILINCTHFASDNNTFTYAEWGNFIRVGGIAGAAPNSVSNSYSGGTITVSNDTLVETFNTNSKNNDSYNRGVTKNNILSYIDDTGELKYNSVSSNDGASVQNSTNVYLAGIVGSGFAMNYQNFTDDAKLKEGNPKVTNCYTYIEFPTFEGTIRSISAIASVADRYGQGANVTINNCYYLNSSIDNTNVNLATYGFAVQDGHGYAYTSDWRGNKTYTISPSADNIYNSNKSYFENMFNGRSDWLFYTLSNDSSNHSSTLSGLPTSLTYSQLSCDNDYDILSKLGNSFSKVSTQDASGVTVDGKYSFPGSDDALQGKNYPFPTVINEDKFNVHYGEWPFYGAYFSSGITTFDLFDELDIENNAEFAYKDIILNTNGSDLSNVTFESSSKDVATIEKTEKNSDGNYVVTLKVLKAGSTTLTAKWNENIDGQNVEQTATTSVNITAELNMTADQTEFTLGSGDSGSTKVYIKSNNGNDYTNSIAKKIGGGNGFGYSVQTVDDFPLALIEENGNKFTITGSGQNATIQVKAFYLYNGNLYEGNLTLYVYRTGAVGLSNGDDYNEADLCGETTSNSGDIGKVVSYTTSVKPTSDNEYFLYVANDEDLLSYAKENNLISIKLKDVNDEDIDESKYSIIYDSNVSNVNEYGYNSLGFKVIFRGEELDGLGASIYAEIKDERSNTYVLSLDNLIIPVTPYQLTLDANGGNLIGESSLTIDADETLFKDLITPERKGYSFFKWYSYDENNKVYYDDSANKTLKEIFTSDTTLYAEWQIENYSITYDLSGGTNSTSNPTTYNIESDDISLTNPTKAGYEFDHWVDGNNKTITKISKGSTGDIKLTAIWKEITYTITYNLNGGTNDASNPTSYTVNSEDITLKDPVWAGTAYQFGGWYDSNGDKVEIIYKGSTGNIKLTAVWNRTVKLYTWNGNNDTEIGSIIVHPDGTYESYSINDNSFGTEYTLIGFYNGYIDSSKSVITIKNGSDIDGSVNVDNIGNDNKLYAKFSKKVQQTAYFYDSNNTLELNNNYLILSSTSDVGYALSCEKYDNQYLNSVTIDNIINDSNGTYILTDNNNIIWEYNSFDGYNNLKSKGNSEYLQIESSKKLKTSSEVIKYNWAYNNNNLLYQVSRNDSRYLRITDSYHRYTGTGNAWYESKASNLYLFKEGTLTTYEETFILPSEATQEETSEDIEVYDDPILVEDASIEDNEVVDNEIIEDVNNDEVYESEININDSLEDDYEENNNEPEIIESEDLSNEEE